MFSELKIGNKFNKEILNNALKELYYTNYFESVILKTKAIIYLLKKIQ